MNSSIRSDTPYFSGIPFSIFTAVNSNLHSYTLIMRREQAPQRSNKSLQSRDYIDPPPVDLTSQGVNITIILRNCYVIVDTITTI